MKAENILIILTTLLIITSLLMFNPSSIKAEPTLWIVPTMIPTIQDAIHIAASGDTILVKSGIYIENIIIDTPNLTIIGEGIGNTILDVGPLNPSNPPVDAIWILTDNVKIMGFTICCSLPTPEWPFSSGIVIENSKNIVILNNEIKEFADTAIKLFHCSNSQITGNHIRYCGIGIYLEHSNYSEIAYNSAIELNGIGIQTISSGNNIIHKNNFNKNGPPQAGSVLGDINAWDADYPNGGNFWSDYTGSDLYSGPYQNITGSDGIGDTPYVINTNNADRYPLINPYPWGPHDISIASLTTSKTVVNQGYSTTINVTASNQGNSTQTFNVIVYANATAVGTQTVLNLAPNASTTLTIIWNTTGFAKGNYTMSAYATPVPSETDTADNTYIDGWILVTIIGDVNGDLKVDLKDVYAVALAYGSYPGHPRWNPNLDINDDDKIDLKDYYATVLNYGKTDP